MKKWLGVLLVAIFNFYALNVLADDQITITDNSVADASQPVPVPQNSDQAATTETIPAAAAPIDFGDYKSETLVGKAWTALAGNDLDSVLAYTNKCISMYAKQAKDMQASLTEYASGSNDDIFKYWALNDVATAYFIQGEAYRTANKKSEAKDAYSKVVSDYSFGQCWDPQGWFWKPAEAAQKKLNEMDNG
jgi:hypothetical protein